jgi:hypothetical protein
MSGALQSHLQLVTAGSMLSCTSGTAGLWHGVFTDPDLPESRQAYELLTRFFDKHLSESSVKESKQ